MKTLDLNICRPGDLLISKHGMVLKYVEALPEEDYYDHRVEYPDKSGGTRCNNGYVYKNPNSRLPEDHDIVSIITSDFEVFSTLE